MRPLPALQPPQAPPPLLLLLLLLCGGSQCLQQLSPSKCVPIKQEICQNIGYNYTTAQSDGRILLTFGPLIHYNCSSSLRFFLCSTLLPMCDFKWRKPIGPCRPLCERVHRRCYPVIRNFGFKWPPLLNCSQFPAASKPDEMCMEGLLHADDQPPPGPPSPPSQPDAWRRRWLTYQAVAASGRAPPDCGHLRNSAKYVFLNASAACALACHGHDLFGEDDKRLAEVWMATLAALCFLSCLATVFAFLADRSRFRYPLRPVVLMAVCYLCYSVSFFVRLLAGREAAACDKDLVTGAKVLTVGGLENGRCAMVFLLQYFFSTAAAAWFAVLVLTWLLQAGCKWSPESLDKRSCYFHLAWAVAGLLTVCVLISRRVEADELFALCGVGGQSSRMLLAFVIAPRLLLLLLQAVCLVAGFVSLWRIRRHVRNDGQATKKFDVLTCKIGLFSALYMLPAACECAVHLYEYASRDLWHVPLSPYSPSVALLLIRCFGSLAIGVTIALWICSRKTLQAWRGCLPALLAGRQTPGAKEAAYRVHLQPAHSASSSKASSAACSERQHLRQQAHCYRQQQLQLMEEARPVGKNLQNR